MNEKFLYLIVTKLKSLYIVDYYIYKMPYKFLFVTNTMAWNYSKE